MVQGIWKTRWATVTAALLAPAVLLAWDLIVILRAPPTWTPPWVELAIFAVALWGVGATIATLAALARAEAVRACKRLPHGAALAGAFDGALFAALVVLGHAPATLRSTEMRIVAWLVVLTVGALIGHFLVPRFSRLIAALSLIGAVLTLPTLLPSSDTFLRVTLHGVIVIAIATALDQRHARPVVLAIGVACAVLLACAAGPLLSDAPAARSMLAMRSVQARAWTSMIERAVDHDRDLATNFFGARDCDTNRGAVFPGARERMQNGRDDNCQGGDGVALAPPARSRARGAAAGQDILIVSIDSLRFDLRDALDKTRAALGSHAELTRAVSPTPKTVTSIASMLRGHPFRQLRLEAVPGLRNHVPGRESKTLGEVLTAAGYQTLTVTTHRYLGPEGRVLAGFRALTPSDNDAAARFVRAESAIELVLQELPRSPKPAAVFLHLMESHHPYRYGDKTGPDSLVGLRASVRYLDAAVATFIGRVTQARGRSPVVAVLGDHGEEFGEHTGRLHASTVHAEQVRVALLLAGPQVPSGAFDMPVSTAALPATLLELAGIAAPASMTEPSMLAYLTGDAPASLSSSSVAVSEIRGDRTVVGYTWDRYRLLRDPLRDAHMLFDSSVDPLEQRDLAQSEPELLRDLVARAKAWDEQH